MGLVHFNLSSAVKIAFQFSSRLIRLLATNWQQAITLQSFSPNLKELEVRMAMEIRHEGASALIVRGDRDVRPQGKLPDY
jgi:hypothetical protein